MVASNWVVPKPKADPLEHNPLYGQYINNCLAVLENIEAVLGTFSKLKMTM